MNSTVAGKPATFHSWVMAQGADAEFGPGRSHVLMEEAERVPSAREFAHHAHHHRRPAAIAGAAIFGLSLVIAALLPPKYRATAILAVLPSPEFTVRAAAGSHELNASALAMDQIMKAETEILGSDELHQAAIHAVGPARLYPAIYDPARRGKLRRLLHAVASTLLSPWRVQPADADAAREQQGVSLFRTNLKVLPAKDANVITVTFDNASPATAAGTLNTLLSLYAERRTALYVDPQLAIVRAEAQAGARDVAGSDARLAAFKRAHAISDYEAQRDILLRRRSQADQAVADATIAAREHTARLAALSLQLGAEQPTIGLYTEQDADTRLQTVNGELEAVRAKLAMAGDKYRESSRTITALRAELRAHETEQARLTHDRTLSVVREGRNPTIDPLRLDRAREIAELAATRARLDAQAAEQTTLSAALASLDADEAALAQLQRERASADDNFRTASRILAERHLSEAEDASRLANVRVIQKAVIPQTPRATPMLVIAAGLLLAVAGSFGWIVVAFIRRPVFFTGEGLASATSLPVLAVFQRREEELLI